MKKEAFAIMIEKKVNDGNSEKSEKEIETHDKLEKLKYPQDYEGAIFILDGLYVHMQKNEQSVSTSNVSRF